MGILRNFKVMVSCQWGILLLLAALELSSAHICLQGKQYLSDEKCVNCTICDGEKGLVVLKPCEVHRDTLCGQINEVANLTDFHYRHQHNKHTRHNKHRRNGLANHHVSDFGSSPAPEVTSTEIPFSSAETLVWDWQAIALTLAVFSCILFFLVITLYSLHQAKQWRRLKENFEADVEELSARLSLMAASSNEKGEVLEPSLGPIHDGNYLNNRYVYLEQLLNVRKDTKTGTDAGNVYIEETNAKASSSS